MGNNEWNAESTFGERLEDLIKEKGVKHQEIADAIGVNKSQISKWCSGSCEAPGAKKVIALAKYFNVTSDYLLGLSNVKTNQNVEIDQLGLNAEAIEWLKLLYTSANDPYNRKQQEAKRYLMAINGVLNICFSASHPVSLEALDLFYNAFCADFENIVVADGSKLYDNPQVLINAIRNELAQQESFLHVQGKELSEEDKACCIADVIDNKRFVYFEGPCPNYNVYIGAEDAHEKSLNFFINHFKDAYRRVRRKANMFNEYSAIKKNEAYFSAFGVDSSLYKKLLDKWNKELHKDDDVVDNIAHNTEFVKYRYIYAIEQASQHDSDMTPDEWCKYVQEKYEKDLIDLLRNRIAKDKEGDPDGNI